MVLKRPLPTFLLGECCPPALTLMSDTSLPPGMTLVPFKLLCWCWFRGSESAYMSPYVGYLRGTALDSRSVFRRLNTCWFLQPEVMGTYILGTGTLGWQALWGWNSLFPRHHSRIFSHHTYMWNQCTVSLPLIPIWMDVVSLIP